MQIKVEPLPHDALTTLVRSGLRAAMGGVADEQSVAQITELSAGNPFFARELTARAAHAATLRPLPASLHAALDQRLGVLSARSRRALLEVAVRGAPASDDPGIGGLHEALQADVIRVDGTRVRFAHPLLLEAVLDAASPRELRRAHRRAAAATTDPVAAALHIARSSGPDPSVARQLDDAVGVALRRGDLHGAQELARLALALTPEQDGRPARRLVVLAERLAELNGLQKAGECAEEAVRSDAGPELTSRALIVAGEAAADSSVALKRF